MRLLNKYKPDWKQHPDLMATLIPQRQYDEITPEEHKRVDAYFDLLLTLEKPPS